MQPNNKPTYYFNTVLTGLLIMGLSGLSLGILLLNSTISSNTIFVWISLVITTIMVTQGLFTLNWMLYAWDDPKKLLQNRGPKSVSDPFYTFTAILPAREESRVIADTIKAVDQIQYPTEKKEILIVCRHDDLSTIQAAQTAIDYIGNPRIRLIIFNDEPINKPHALNQAMHFAQGQIITIFDAEDQPHPQLYNSVNTIFLKEQVDIVQAGVQLMNTHKPWFASLNVMEYFFWFKSALHFFSKHSVIPLGGNSVFFKREWIFAVGGWDEYALTEDADIGIRLSAAGAKTRVVYNEHMATQEETPPTLGSFLRQRTRWNQGFLQVLDKGHWTLLPSLKQKLLALYILIWPIVQAFILFIYIPLSIAAIIYLKLPVPVALYSTVPLFIIVLQILIYAIGYLDFTRNYHQHYSIITAAKMLLFYFPFQAILSLAAFRACIRHMKRDYSWEKTEHRNVHRIPNPNTSLVINYAKA